MTLNDTFERRSLFQTRVHAWDDVVAVQGRRLDLRAGHVTVEPALAHRAAHTGRRVLAGLHAGSRLASGCSTSASRHRCSTRRCGAASTARDAAL